MRGRRRPIFLSGWTIRYSSEARDLVQVSNPCRISGETGLEARTCAALVRVPLDADDFLPS